MLLHFLCPYLYNFLPLGTKIVIKNSFISKSKLDHVAGLTGTLSVSLSFYRSALSLKADLNDQFFYSALQKRNLSGLVSVLASRVLCLARYSFELEHQIISTKTRRL